MGFDLPNVKFVTGDDEPVRTSLIVIAKLDDDDFSPVRTLDGLKDARTAAIFSTKPRLTRDSNN